MFMTISNYEEIMCTDNTHELDGWCPVSDKILTKSLKQLRTSFEQIDVIRVKDYDLELYKMKDEHIYVLGVGTNDYFATVLGIEFKYSEGRMINIQILTDKSLNSNIITKKVLGYFKDKGLI